jgi:hypothetical protein
VLNRFIRKADRGRCGKGGEEGDGTGLPGEGPKDEHRQETVFDQVDASNGG